LDIPSSPGSWSSSASSVFIDKKNDRVGGKGSGDTTKVYVQTLWEAF
jgi:hypothetical protein